MNAIEYVRKIAHVISDEGLPGLNYRIRFRYFNFLCSLMRKFGADSVPSAYGIRLKANWDDATFKWCVNGGYGYFLSDFLRSQDSEFTFIDIGANQGLYTILAAKNPYCRHVYSFEPVKSTAQLLRANIALNNIRNSNVFEYAISDVKGTARIQSPSNHSGAATLRNTDSDNEIGLLEEIDCVTAVELNNFISASRRCVVKIDVEGFESIVINELRGCDFFENVSDVFYEVDERWLDGAALIADLESLGFDSFRKIGEGRTHYDVLASRNDAIEARQ